MSDPNNFYWKCPKCNAEQKVNSPYFSADKGGRMRCLSCNSVTYCHHPSSTFPKRSGEVVAYAKD